MGGGGGVDGYRVERGYGLEGSSTWVWVKNIWGTGWKWIGVRWFLGTLETKVGGKKHSVGMGMSVVGSSGVGHMCGTIDPLIRQWFWNCFRGMSATKFPWGPAICHGGNF